MKNITPANPLFSKTFKLAVALGLVAITLTPVLEGKALSREERERLIDAIHSRNNNQAQAQNQEQPNERRSYLMTCRGGRNTAITLRTAGNSDMSFNFTKAPQSATAAPVAAGQCAWQDRPIHRDEPTKLILNAPISDLNLTYTLGTSRLSGLQIVSNPDNAPQQLIRQLSSGNTFFLQARRSDDGNAFLITRVGL